MPGFVVHHIHPVGEHPDVRLSLGNLIYVSARTHKAIHDAYDKSPQTKKEMQSRLFAALAGNADAWGRVEKVRGGRYKTALGLNSRKNARNGFIE